MAEINYRLLEHPAAQRKPETHDEWLNFVKVLVEYTSNPDAIDVAVEGGTSLANALPNASRNTSAVESLEIAAAQTPLDNDTRNTSAIKELQTRAIQDDVSDENRREVPTEEIQFENSSNDGELLANGGSIYSPTPSLGHVPEASTRDLNKYAYGFGAPQPAWGQEALDRGKVWWDESRNALKLRTEAPGVELELGKQVAYKVLNNAFGVTLTKGTLVMATGSFFGAIVVKKAQAISQAGGASGNKLTYTNVLGMVAEDILYKDIGYAIAFGEVSGLDTTVDSVFAATSNGPLYLSDTVAGGWEVNPPQRRVQIGTIGHKDATNGRIAVNILDQDFVTYTGVSFQITGNPTGVGTGSPTIHKEFNVDPLGAPLITRPGGVGVYRVTLNWYTRDWYSATLAPGTCILDNLIENWTCKDLATAGATAGSSLDRRAYITAIDPTASPNKAWFEFTYFGVQIPAIAAVPSPVTAVELQPMDMTATDELTFFGQLLPFKPISG